MVMPAAASPKGQNLAFMTLFLLATGMTTLAIAGTMPILPLLQAHFSLSAHAAMLTRATVTIGAIGLVVGAPLTAFGAARFGRKPLLVGAALVFALAGCSGYFLDNLPLIVASRFLAGAAAALFTTLTITIVADSYDEADRNRWMGIMVGAGTLMAMALLPLAGVLGDIGWRESFLLHLLGAPLAVLAWFGYRSSYAPAHAAGPRGGAHRAPLRPGMIALGLCVGVTVNAQAMYAPFKLQTIGVHSAAQIGVTLMPMMLLSALASPLYGRLRTVVSIPLAFALGFLGLALGLAVFYYAPTWTVALCGYGLFGAAMGITVSNLYALGSQADHAAHREATLGQTLAAFYAASLVAQLLLEPLTVGRPAQALLWLAAFSALMCVAAFAFVLRPATR
jgi:predicted MFS family arabinose efflux permease